MNGDYDSPDKMLSKTDIVDSLINKHFGLSKDTVRKLHNELSASYTTLKWHFDSNIKMGMQSGVEVDEATLIHKFTQSTKTNQTDCDKTERELWRIG